MTHGTLMEMIVCMTLENFNSSEVRAMSLDVIVYIVLATIT